MSSAGERIDKSFRLLVIAAIAVAALLYAGAMFLVLQGEAVVAAVFATITFFLFRMFWRATQRKRVLLRQGWFAGRRTGNHWAYDELHDGMIESIELPLDYVGRGEYDIHVPGQQDWPATMPPWARDRREEIVERLATVFKRSQMLFDADKAADSAQSPTP